MKNSSLYLLEHIDIEINHRCNLYCRHCSAKAVKGSSSAELSVSEIKDILAEGKKLGLRKVGLTGGEPLLEVEKIEAISKFCIDELGLSLHMHTNGTLIKEVINNNGDIFSLFESISITFLGGDEKTHDYMTSTPGTFNKAFEGSRLFSERGLPLTCYFIPTHGTCEGFKNLAFRLYEIGVRRIRAMALAPSGRARTIYGETAPPKEEMDKFEEDLLEIASELGIIVEAGYCTRLSMPKLSTLSGHETCLSGINRVHINSKGDVFPCTAASGVKELSLGNLRDNSFNLADIWQNSNLVKRIRLLHKGLLNFCQDCSKVPNCRFGCLVNACGTMDDKLRMYCPVTNLKKEL